ncbi:MAG: MazG nucleotide pyrophosphohydrolase [Clostridia bacterium]|jgi:NTP pyrophosphatase (non-canonical NTP hydrolase)|nr:MazG nucleotide pyrophosphohydrolase [Clostridia bacterium]MDF2891817.1 MazG nucleotide pyrophosphohydrolase [Clostridia bacterium]
MEKNNGIKYKSISLPRLNNLKPNIESTALKLMEEAGELAQIIGKFRGLNGEKFEMTEKEVIEKMSEELLDVAQVAVSMMFVLEETYNVDIEEKVQQHIQKLIRKKYIRE